MSVSLRRLLWTAGLVPRQTIDYKHLPSCWANFRPESPVPVDRYKLYTNRHASHRKVIVLAIGFES